MACEVRHNSQLQLPKMQFANHNWVFLNCQHIIKHGYICMYIAIQFKPKYVYSEVSPIEFSGTYFQATEVRVAALLWLQNRLS